LISTDRKHGDGPSYPIPVWNGIFDHRRKIGPAIWVFLWCLDRITREESGVGIVLGGSVVTAEKIASELQESARTIRRHFRRLTKYGYVGLKRTPYGFIITVANSRKIDIWRGDKNCHPERTKMPVRWDKSAGQTDKIVRSIKEDSAVDSAVDSTERERKNLPPAYSQRDFDERDIRKMGAAQQEAQKRPNSVGSLSEREYFAWICRQAGITVQRGLQLEQLQVSWPTETTG
jgi:hypothetical protein